jgi:hypothetical protein
MYVLYEDFKDPKRHGKHGAFQIPLAGSFCVVGVEAISRMPVGHKCRWLFVWRARAIDKPSVYQLRQISKSGWIIFSPGLLLV